MDTHLCINIRAINSGLSIKTSNVFKKLAREVMSKIIDMIPNEAEDRVYKLSCKELFLDIFLINDGEMTKLNHQYRDNKSATNVLSLQFFSEEELRDNKLDVLMLGSIFISMDSLQKESLEQKIDIKEHFSRLLIHGLLHLIGYDHNNEEDARKMYGKEEILLKNLSLDVESLVINYWR